MSFEGNKIAAAVLVAMILAMVSGILADHLVAPAMLAKPAYSVAVTGGAPAAATAAPQGPEPIGALLAQASAATGKQTAHICEQCHNFNKGGANKIGPDLYDIVGDKIANGRNGFDFSSALKSKQGQTWTIDDLNDWLWRPQSFAPGTKMTFVGFPKAKDRANVIAFLNSLGPDPKSLAELAKTAAAGAAPAAAASTEKVPAKGQPNATKPAAGMPAAAARGANPGAAPKPNATAPSGTKAAIPPAAAAPAAATPAAPVATKAAPAAPAAK